MSLLMLRVNHQELSLWQSVVAGHIKNTHFPLTDLVDSKMKVLQHDMMRATNVFVNNRFNKLPEMLSNAASADNASSIDVQAHLSELAFEIAKAKVENREADVAALLLEVRKFTDDDWSVTDKTKPGFYGCIGTYLEYNKKYGGVFKYNDWKQAKDIDAGVIHKRLPNDARVGIIGDWGTGLPDAYALLYDMLVNQKVDVIIHLGDIYYSGTLNECINNYEALFEKAFNQIGKRVPVYTIPGNHDYYAFGWDYYDVITRMNDLIPGSTQDASYFCLRTEDDSWQFLGMDTGYNDSFPGNQLDWRYAGPWLTNNELLWHLHKLDTFKGSTILLSHHQLFSANSEINKSRSDFSKTPYINPFLLYSFRSFFKSKVAAWLWGHEHNAVIYQDNLFGLAKGRLIGASAYEEMEKSFPYVVKYPQVPYYDPEKYRVSTTQGYYNHSYAVIDLSVRRYPAESIQATYYEFPSWGATAPPDPKSKIIFIENFTQPSSPQREPILNSAPVLMKLGSGVEFIGNFYNGPEYYPKLAINQGVGLRILDSRAVIGTPLHDKSIVNIQTTESSVGQYNFLGAWSTRWLYYYSLQPGSLPWSGQNWQIVKQTPSDDPQLYYGDAVSFQSIGYPGRWMSVVDDEYLGSSTNEAEKIYFILMKD